MINQTAALLQVVRGDDVVIFTGSRKLLELLLLWVLLLVLPLIQFLLGDERHLYRQKLCLFMKGCNQEAEIHFDAWCILVGYPGLVMPTLSIIISSHCSLEGGPGWCADGGHDVRHIFSKYCSNSWSFWAELLWGDLSLRLLKAVWNLLSERSKGLD